MAVNNFDWTQYPTINSGSDTYYLIRNLDDNLCIAVKKSDTDVDDESAASAVPFYCILAQLDATANV